MEGGREGEKFVLVQQKEDLLHSCVSPPLSNVERLNDPGNLVDKGDCSRDVVEHRDVPDLFPWHGNVLNQFQHCMWNVFQGTIGESGSHS